MGNHSLCQVELQLHINKMNSFKSFCSEVLGAEWVFLLVPCGNTKRASAHSLGVKGLQTLRVQGCISPGGWLLAGMVGQGHCLEPRMWTEDLQQPI